MKNFLKEYWMYIIAMAILLTTLFLPSPPVEKKIGLALYTVIMTMHNIKRFNGDRKMGLVYITIMLIILIVIVSWPLH